MSNSLKTIHYAIEIKTSSTLDNSSIGLFGGSFRYVTDGYDTTGSTFEDTTPNTDTWDSTLLMRDGIKPSSQSIDIVTGGDYSFLGSINVDIANTDRLHKIITTTQSLYLVGSAMTFYVVIDDVFYTRWSGVVSEYSFNDTTFTFTGADKNNSDNRTINNYNFGLSYLQLDPIIEDEQPLYDNQFIKYITPEDPSGNVSVNFYDYQPIDMANTQAVMFSGYSKGNKKINSNPQSYRIGLNGFVAIKDGMFAKFTGSDVLYYIKDVTIESYESAEGDTINATSFVVSSLPPSLVDFNNLYGKQVEGAPESLVSATQVASDDTVRVSIFNYGNRFKIPNDTKLLTENGKYVILDEDGTESSINGNINSDGTLTIIDKSYTTITKPINIKYFSDAKDGSVTQDIDAGKAINIQSLGTTINDIPNDFDINGNYWKSDFDKWHYFILEFSKSIENKMTAIIVDSYYDSIENWKFDNSAFAVNSRCIHMDSNYLDLDVPTQYFKYAGAPGLKHGAMPVYIVENYKIITDQERGEIPFKINDFSMPNVRRVTDFNYDSRSGTGFRKWVRINVKSIPASSINEEYFKTTTNRYPSVYCPEDSLYEWGNYASVTAGKIFYYPINKYDGFTKPEDITTTNKMLVRVSYDSTFLGADDRVVKYSFQQSEGGTVFDIDADSSNLPLFVNSIGLYEVKTITADSKIFYKGIQAETGSYNGLLQDLTQTTSTLDNRLLWDVGGVIDEETNVFDVVTKLCKQGFVAGNTDRQGNIVFKEFLEVENTPLIDNNDNIIDNSIGKLKLTPITKTYNEFTVKYNYFNNTPLKTLGVYNVDKDSFPSITEIDPVWSVAKQYNGDTLELSNGVYTLKAVIGVQTDIIDEDTNNLFRLKTSLYRDVIVTNASLQSTDGTYNYYTVDYISSDLALPSSFQTPIVNFYYNVNNDFALWKTYVVGIDSYPDAKDLWEKARNSFLLNSRIRKAPSDRTELRYAIDTSLFLNDDSIDQSVRYGREYFDLLVGWTTRQKLQVNYSLPITADTITRNIMDDVHFSDPIITPDVNEYGKGWITSIGVDTKKDLLNVTVTFEPDFFTPPTAFPECDNIIEAYTNTDNIIEDYNNVDNIIEQYEC